MSSASTFSPLLPSTFICRTRWPVLRLMRLKLIRSLLEVAG
jgi:hypothetical protein